MIEPEQCPVCRARFRCARICSRCGADLSPLMRLSVEAWMLREAARDSLAASDLASAYRLAARAQRLQVTGAGGALCLLSAWLGAGAEDRRALPLDGEEIEAGTPAF